LKLGRVLGRGAFCVVNEIVSIKTVEGDNTTPIDTSDCIAQYVHKIAAVAQTITNEHDDPANDNELEFFDQSLSCIIQDRSFMANYYIRGHTNNCRYAIKMLQSNNKKDATTYINGVVDLAIEAKFLSVLQHENIIKLRAVASCDPFDAPNCSFIILDRLYDTLTVRLGKWKKQQPTNGSIRKLFDRKGKRERAQFMERLTFAFDLSCALKYLHSKK
jgi:serine/threonine protein kinase